MKYPKLKREQDFGHLYLSFTQLKDIKAKEVKDTITVYDNTATSEKPLSIWVDIDKNDEPCGIKIIYHK